MSSYKSKLMYHGAAITHGIEERKTTTRGKLAKGALTLFTTADGRTCALTRDAIDKGLPQAAGIRIIDGDKPDGEGIRDVEPVGNG